MSFLMAHFIKYIREKEDRWKEEESLLILAVSNLFEAGKEEN
jgi:hypothetical protein